MRAVVSCQLGCGSLRHPVQFLQDVFRELKGGGGEVLAEVGDGRGAGDEEDVGGVLQEPGQGDGHGGGFEGGCGVRERGGLERGEAAEWEVRDVGDALGIEGVDEAVVFAVGEVVVVLHADDLAMGRASSNWAGETLLRPMCWMRPCC